MLALGLVTEAGKAERIWHSIQGCEGGGRVCRSLLAMGDGPQNGAAIVADLLSVPPPNQTPVTVLQKVTQGVAPIQGTQIKVQQPSTRSPTVWPLKWQYSHLHQPRLGFQLSNGTSRTTWAEAVRAAPQLPGVCGRWALTTAPLSHHLCRRC